MPPLYSILFETSIFQFNSSKCSPIMPDEFREQRSETIPSSRITPDHLDSQLHVGASPLQFTSLMSCSTGFRSEDWDDHIRSLFCAQGPIFLLFFMFWLLYGWKIQTWPIIRFLTESVTYWFFICWYLIDAMCLNKMSRTSSRNIGPQHQKYSNIFNYTHGVLFIRVHQIHLVCLHFLVSSDHRSQSHLKFQLCLTTEYAGVCFWMS